ncbi:hypothetical protein E2562_005282 [Oryza meyeriana var. granulata]|uniref:Uncharacterized protein n=1 Tax=Oryza meyeriana var. granulata TaxID=110450 RepID=A0A6G1EF64_9ORYZ|nr:hypothetical protein E2562_005282 [Oryza meyeriana var. granulata]
MDDAAATKGKRRPHKAAAAAAAAAKEAVDGKDGPAEGACGGRGGGGRFFCYYLLRSLCPRSNSTTAAVSSCDRLTGWIDGRFTVNPPRLIRQHSDEIRCGAWQTKRGSEGWGILLVCD